jgi:hypothetical protein
VTGAVGAAAVAAAATAASALLISSQQLVQHARQKDIHPSELSWVYSTYGVRVQHLLSMLLRTRQCLRLGRKVFRAWAETTAVTNRQPPSKRART